MSLPLIGRVRLGVRGPTVGVQGLGCMGMSEFYGTADDAQSVAVIHHALDRGATLIDTADMYGIGHNEELVGRAIAERRDEAVVATKIGFERHPADPRHMVINNRPEYIRAAVDGSLRRLRVDSIDLLYLHRRDPAVPLAESYGTMAEIVAAGKARFLGLSAVGAAELREAHAIRPLAALQSEWSLFARDVEGIVPTARELGIAVVAYSPLGRGMLTGRLSKLEASDIRNTLPRFAGDEGVSNAALVGKVVDRARLRGIAPAQLALAWLHRRSEIHRIAVVPIPGSRSINRLDENLHAAAISLDDEDLAVLEPLAQAVAGERFGYAWATGPR